MMNLCSRKQNRYDGNFYRLSLAVDHIKRLHSEAFWPRTLLTDLVWVQLSWNEDEFSLHIPITSLVTFLRRWQSKTGDKMPPSPTWDTTSLSIHWEQRRLSSVCFYSSFLCLLKLKQKQGHPSLHSESRCGQRRNEEPWGLWGGHAVQSRLFARVSDHSLGQTVSAVPLQVSLYFHCQKKSCKLYIVSLQNTPTTHVQMSNIR